MMHKIDLSKYDIRTDLIIEEVGNDTSIEEINEDGIKVSKVSLMDNNILGKKAGYYTTISFSDITDSTNYEKVLQVTIREIRNILFKEQIKDDDKILIIGLGNQQSTPDALGVKVINNVIVTRHLYLLGDCDSKYRNVSAYAPGVMGNSGIETSDIIEGIVAKINPDLLIVVDALCASNIERINKTIQITNTGIHPGSGIGNNRHEISKETLKIPVIAIGVPTVVDSVVIVHDTIEYLMRKISYLKDNLDNVVDKMRPLEKINYTKSENKLSLKEKKALLGDFGLLNENDKKKLIYEVLSPINANMIVTVKEIDFIIDKLSHLIAEALNKTLHRI